MGQKNYEKFINSETVKGIIQRITEDMEDALKIKIARTDKGMFFGKRLSRNQLYRHDQRIFERKSLPEETDLAITLLIDLSGSMSSYNRLELARITSIIIYEYCVAAGVPISIFGHNVTNAVDIYSLADWDSEDDNDKYRIASMRCNGCNRDGAAMKYALEHLSKRDEKKKLFIIISDGLPNDGGYYGQVAYDDIRAIKNEYLGRDIYTFAAAIGEDRKTIEEIYGDGYLNISNLKNLPENLVNLINEYLLD